jgi:hypothetical protein
MTKFSTKFSVILKQVFELCTVWYKCVLPTSTKFSSTPDCSQNTRPRRPLADFFRATYYVYTVYMYYSYSVY